MTDQSSKHSILKFFFQTKTMETIFFQTILKKKKILKKSSHNKKFNFKRASGYCKIYHIKILLSNERLKKMCDHVISGQSIVHYII